MSSATSSSSSSTPSLAVIVACSAVGGVIFIVIAVRVALCVHRRRVLKPLPLPPARPLTVLHEMPWNNSRSLSKLDLAAPSLGAYHSGNAYMSQYTSPQGQGVSRHYSVSTEETPLRQPPSPLTPFSASSTDSQLVPPQPSFTTPSRRNSNRSSAQVSVISSADGSDIGSYPPQRHQSTTALPVILPPEDRTPVQDAAGDTTAQQPLPSQPSRGRARPLSIATSTSSVNTSASKKTARSSRSLSTIRGAPHGIHSKIEIVLPSPLASQSQQYISPTKAAAYLHPEMGEGTTDLASNSMQSMCDPWIRVGRDSTSNTMGLPRHGQARRSHIGDFETHTGPRSRSSRLSISSSSSQTTSNGASSALYTSRSSSVSSRSHSPRKASVELARLPPVPRVPSVYYNATASSSHSPVTTSPESNLDEGLLLDTLDIASVSTSAKDKSLYSARGSSQPRSEATSKTLPSLILSTPEDVK